MKRQFYMIEATRDRLRDSPMHGEFRVWSFYDTQVEEEPLMYGEHKLVEINLDLGEETCPEKLN